MNQTNKSAATKHLLTGTATLWLALATGGFAADPAPATPPAAAGEATAVLVDENMPWQHLHLEGPSYFLLDDATTWVIPAHCFGSRNGPRPCRRPIGPGRVSMTARGLVCTGHRWSGKRYFRSEHSHIT